MILENWIFNMSDRFLNKPFWALIVIITSMLGFPLMLGVIFKVKLMQPMSTYVIAVSFFVLGVSLQKIFGK